MRPQSLASNRIGTVQGSTLEVRIPRSSPSLHYSNTPLLQYPTLNMILLSLQTVWRRPCRRSPKPFTSGPAPALLHSNSRSCLESATDLRERDKPRNTRNTRKAKREEVCFPRVSRIPRLIPPAFVCSFAALCYLCLFAAILLPIAAARAQDTNPPSLQYSNTPPLQYTNAPSLQYSTPPALSRFVETNQPPPLLPPAFETAPASRLAGTSQLAPASAVPLPPVPPLLRWGPLTLQSHLLYSLSYGNGLQATPGQSSSSFINEVDPGILFQWGSHWSLDYTPTLRFYSSSAFKDSFDNAVTLTGGTTYEDWSFGLSQSYASSSDPIIETASQLDQETYFTGLSATRQLGSQTSLELGASQSFRFIDSTFPGAQSDTRSWSTMDWLNYQFWPRFGAAIGTGFGYDNLAVGTDMTSEQLQGRITWKVVDKLSFVLSGGAEDRQFLAAGVPDLISPIFSFSAQYSLFEATTLSLSASRMVSPSFFQDQITESTAISAGLHQRLLGKLSLDLSGGYGTSTYHASSTAPVAANVSNYDTTSFSARLSLPVLKGGSAAVFYSVNYNTSGGANYNYTTTQVGLQLSYRY